MNRQLVDELFALTNLSYCREWGGLKQRDLVAFPDGRTAGETQLVLIRHGLADGGR